MPSFCCRARDEEVEAAATKMRGRCGHVQVLPILLLHVYMLLMMLMMCMTYNIGNVGEQGISRCAAAAAASDQDKLATVNAVRREGVDSSLRKYAFLAVSDQQQQAAARRDKVCNVKLTPVLEGIESQALRLPRASTLRQQGLTFNEISIPQGANLVSSYKSDIGPGGAPADHIADDSPLLLIYRKIVNFTVYSLPASFSFAGPVVGIIAYIAPSDFTTDDPALPQLLISSSSSDPGASSLNIKTSLPLSLSSAPSTSISCAFFARNGSISFTPTTSSPTVCTSDILQDVALVLPTQDLPQQQPPRQPQSASSGSFTPNAFLDPHTKGTGTNKHWKLALGATCLALAGFGFCVAFAVASIGVVRRLKVVILARFTGNEEALQTSLIGFSRAPSAPSVRTKPVLEMDMACFD